MKKSEETHENCKCENKKEGEQKMMEQYNEKKFYDYLNREKTENPWEEKDFSLAFMYL